MAGHSALLPPRAIEADMEELMEKLSGQTPDEILPKPEEVHRAALPRSARQGPLLLVIGARSHEVAKWDKEYPVHFGGVRDHRGPLLEKSDEGDDRPASETTTNRAEATDHLDRGRGDTQLFLELAQRCGTWRLSRVDPAPREGDLSRADPQGLTPTDEHCHDPLRLLEGQRHHSGDRSTHDRVTKERAPRYREPHPKRGERDLLASAKSTRSSASGCGPNNTGGPGDRLAIGEAAAISSHA